MNAVKKSILVWSPFVSKVGTVQNVINSLNSINGINGINSINGIITRGGRI